MEEFINTDFWNNYRIIFPDHAFIIVGFIAIWPLLAITAISIYIIIDKFGPNSGIYDSDGYIQIITIFYVPFFLIFYIFWIIKYCEFHDSKINCNSLKKIKSEIIIEDFIKSFCSNYNLKNKLLITQIVLLTFSGFLFITGWIANIFIQRAICINIF